MNIFNTITICISCIFLLALAFITVGLLIVLLNYIFHIKIPEKYRQKANIPPIFVTIRQRAPTKLDRAKIGSIWIDYPNDDSYIIAKIINKESLWIKMED